MRASTVATMVGSALVVSGAVRAEVEGEIHVGYATMYEFRGVDVGDHLAEGGADVSWSLNDYTLSAGLWYADVSDNNAESGLPPGHPSRLAGSNELDLYAAIARDLEVAGRTATVELGYIHYTFPDGSTGGPITEPYLGISTELIEGLSVGVASYWASADFEDAGGQELSGWWFDAAASYSQEVCEKVSAEATVGITYSGGYNASDAGNYFDGFDHAYGKLALPVPVSESATVNPFVKGVLNIAGDDRDFVIGGVSLNVAW
jgi:hypothetical protein